MEPLHADRLPPRRRPGQPLLEPRGHPARPAMGRRQRHEGLALPVAAHRRLRPVVSGPRLRRARPRAAVGRAAVRSVGRVGAALVAGLVRVACRRGLVSVVLRAVVGVAATLGLAAARSSVVGADRPGRSDGHHRRRRLLPALPGRLPGRADRGGAGAGRAGGTVGHRRPRPGRGRAGRRVVGRISRAPGRRPALHRPRRAARRPADHVATGALRPVQLRRGRPRLVPGRRAEQGRRLGLVLHRRAAAAGPGPGAVGLRPLSPAAGGRADPAGAAAGAAAVAGQPLPAGELPLPMAALPDHLPLPQPAADRGHHPPGDAGGADVAGGAGGRAALGAALGAEAGIAGRGGVAVGHAAGGAAAGRLAGRRLSHQPALRHQPPRPQQRGPRRADLAAARGPQPLLHQHRRHGHLLGLVGLRL